MRKGRTSRKKYCFFFCKCINTRAVSTTGNSVDYTNMLYIDTKKKKKVKLYKVLKVFNLDLPIRFKSYKLQSQELINISKDIDFYSNNVLQFRFILLKIYILDFVKYLAYPFL